MRIPREDWGTLGKIMGITLGITTPPPLKNPITKPPKKCRFVYNSTFQKIHGSRKECLKQKTYMGVSKNSFFFTPQNGWVVYNGKPNPIKIPWIWRLFPLFFGSTPILLNDHLPKLGPLTQPIMISASIFGGKKPNFSCR